MTEGLRRLLATPQGRIGGALVTLVGLVALAGPALAPLNPETFHFGDRFASPGAQFWLGADQFGRDILSRLLHGARATVLMAAFASVLAAAFGAVIGAGSAFLGGWADDAIMRIVDAVMAIPSLLLALLIVTVLGAGPEKALLAIALASTPGMARVARSTALTVRKQDYVAAARARGEGAGYIVLHEMLPNVAAPIIIEATIRVAFAVMLIATLSFLGLGAQPPSSEWGLMIAEARSYMFQSPWMIVWPGFAIALTAIGFNLLGDGLRDALNPRIVQ
jgi:peptide/nickel transport system permease protein